MTLPCEHVQGMWNVKFQAYGLRRVSAVTEDLARDCVSVCMCVMCLYMPSGVFP